MKRKGGEGEGEGRGVQGRVEGREEECRGEE